MARKIHRYLVLAISALTLIMAFTGLFLKYQFLSSSLNSSSVGLLRYIHNQVSPWLTITLLIMVVTGIMMYFPIYPKKPQSSKE